MNYLILFIYTGFVSIITGFTGLLLTFRWYPMADMLRGLATSSIIFALLLLLPPKASLALVCLLFLPYLAFAVINVFHFINYGSSITYFAVQSILETSLAESRELLAEYLTLTNVLAVAAVIVLALLLFRLALAAARKAPRNKFTVIAGILIIVALIPVIERKNGKVLRFSVELTFIRSAINYREELAHIAKIREARAAFSFDGLEFADGDPEAERNYVFIIGESGNRNHFSLYGYGRETSPRLEAMRGELFVFTDTISHAPYTVQSLRDAFLFADKSILDNTVLLSSRSLINLFNAAGFETYWLSNQTVNSDRLTGASMLAGDAKHRQYFNLADDESKTVLHDDVLLKPLEEILAEPPKKKAIFLHTIGSHTSYKLRYPAEFERFTNPDEVPTTPWREAGVRRYVNEYDNSILYTDHIIAEIIGAVKKRDGRNFVLYFSDHGQEVYDVMPRRGQNSKTPTHHMYEIPFILWLSDEYKDTQQELVRQIEAALDRPFYLPALPSTASELARLKHDAFNPQESVINQGFEEHERILWGKDGTFPYRSLLPKEAATDAI